MRHNLDVMHVEKNICDNIISTLLDLKGKSKDALKSHKDLEELRIRSDLHPKLEENGIRLPTAMHMLSKLEKQTFCKRLFDLKLPYGYGSNIGKCILV